MISLSGHHNNTPPDPAWGSLLGLLQGYVCVVDRDLRMLWMNRLAGGLTSDDVVGHSMLEFTAEADHAEVARVCAEVLRTGEPGTWEVEGYRSEGEVGLYRTTAVRLPTGDGLLLDVTDVTERQQARRERDDARVASQRYAENLERSNADLQQFAYVASHDLQTPLRTISGFVDLLARRMDSLLDEKTRRYMGHITSGVEDMQGLIDGLLAYSRVQSAPRDRWTDVDLGEVFDAVVATCDADVQRTSATIRRGELPTIVADPVQMRQLLQNLIVNALHHRAEGRAPIVSVEAVTADGVTTVQVSDNCRGVHPGISAHIFDIFKQGETNGESGNGVGLALCKKIVERHGGTIKVDTDLGHGSTFLFQLPLEAAPELVSSS